MWISLISEAVVVKTRLELEFDRCVSLLILLANIGLSLIEQNAEEESLEIFFPICQHSVSNVCYFHKYLITSFEVSLQEKFVYIGTNIDIGTFLFIP